MAVVTVRHGVAAGREWRATGKYGGKLGYGNQSYREKNKQKLNLNKLLSISIVNRLKTFSCIFAPAQKLAGNKFHMTS